MFRFVIFEKPSVFFYFCFAVSSTYSENITFPAKDPVLMSCSSGKNILISNINFHEATNRCQSRPCNQSKIKEKITNRCQGKRSCILTANIDDECLEDYGYVDLFYSCNDRIFLCDFETFCEKFTSSYWAEGIWSSWIPYWQTLYKNKFYHWQRVRGNMRWYHRHSTRDHTQLSGIGYYVLADASEGDRGKEAYLKSIQITPNTNQCLSFWYYMRGNHNQTLIVYQLITGTKLTRMILGNSSYNGEAEWQHKVLAMKYSTNRFHVIFKAVHGIGNKGHIALDDISVIKCDGVTHTKTCLNVFKPMRLLECPKRKTDFQTFNATFIPAYVECSETYQYLEDKYVEQCKTTRASSCHVRVNGALQRRSECFKMNRIEIEYSCIEIDDKFVSIEIIGGVSGSALFVLCIVVLIVLRIRKVQRKRANPIQGKTSDENYYNMNPISTLRDEYRNVSYQNELHPTYTELDNTNTGRQHNYTELDTTNTGRQHNYIVLDKTNTDRQHGYTEFENSKSANKQLDNTNTSK